MSITKRQGFKYSIIGYLGILIGALSTYFLFPYNFEYYGKLRFILSSAEILLPIVVFGISYANVKFYIKTKKENQHQNLLFLSLLMMVINFSLLVGGFYLFHWLFPNYQSSELWQYKYYILPLLLILSFSAIFNKYISNFKRIAVPNIFENIFPKLGNIIAFSLVLFIGVSEEIGLLTFIGMFALALVGYVIYANHLEKLKLNFSIVYFKKDQLWKSILDYSFYGFLGNIGNYIAVRIDSYMIGEYIGFEQNGIYLVIFAMLSVISIPQMGLHTIAAPIVNEQIEMGDRKALKSFHQKTALTLFFIGSLLFSCLAVGFPHLVTFIKNGDLLLDHQGIIWILGLAILFDLATGFNSTILSMSKYYRINIYFMLGLALLTIVLNYYFIRSTELGIVGVAIATATSLGLYNIIKLIFNQWKFDVHPFSWKMLTTLLLCSFGILLTYLVPSFHLEVISLLVKVAIIIVVVFIGNHYLKLFPIHEYINKKFIKSLFRF